MSQTTFDSREDRQPETQPGSVAAEVPVSLTNRIMLLNATDRDEVRVATLTDGRLTAFDTELATVGKIKGNIYRGTIMRVDTHLQAAFVRYCEGHDGFLPLKDLPRSTGKKPVLARGQVLMVQVVREPIGTKGALLTGHISLPGRYLVLTPDSAQRAVSRQLNTEERRHFKAMLDELQVPKGIGVIVRTASVGVTLEDFRNDLDRLVETYREIVDQHASVRKDGLVWREDDLVIRTLRDAFSAGMSAVHIDDWEAYQSACRFFQRAMPSHIGVLRHYTGHAPLFAHFGAEAQVDELHSRAVRLPSGGSIVIDQTEAMVTIDVNSGSTAGKGIEGTSFLTNREAAVEIARQLRLRDAGGIIAIDFIDMDVAAHRQVVEETLAGAMVGDRSRFEMDRINKFGVLMMTRQRRKQALHHATHIQCPTCRGMGHIRSASTLALSLVRKISAAATDPKVVSVRAKVNPPIAHEALNRRRSALMDLEASHGVSVVLDGDHDVPYGDIIMEVTHGVVDIPLVDEAADEVAMGMGA